MNIEQTGRLFFGLDCELAKGPKYTMADGELLWLVKNPFSDLFHLCSDVDCAAYFGTWRASERKCSL